MFKWTKLRPSGQPSTPKLSSVSLPDDGPIKRVPTPQWPPDPEKKSKILSTYPDAGRRSKTPHPIPSKHHQDMAGGQTTRTRTTSLTSHIADGFSKPSKASCSDDEFIKPLKPASSLNTGKSYHRDQADGRAGPPYKSILKGGGHSHQTSSMKHPENSELHYYRDASKAKTLSELVPYAGHPEKRGVPPPVHPSISHHGRQGIPPPVHRTFSYNAGMDNRSGIPYLASSYPGYTTRYMPPANHQQDHHPRSRHQSFTGNEGYVAPGSTSRYVKPHITKVPQKEEAIALSWPLLDPVSHGRSRRPRVYFDVGFDPRTDLRKYDGHSYVPFSDEELDISASSHCELTEMIVVGPAPLDRWPIRIRHAKGIQCIDVFQAIYQKLSEPLTEEDVDAVGKPYVERCVRAFKQRCKDSPGLTLYNEKRGMRRVDLLRGRRIFEGLTRDSKSATWVLHIHSFVPESSGQHL